MDTKLIDLVEAVPADVFEAKEEEIDVFCWRMEELLRAGFSPVLAGTLADRTDIDLHRACALRAGGCPEVTAFRILY